MWFSGSMKKSYVIKWKHEEKLCGLVEAWRKVMWLSGSMKKSYVIKWKHEEKLCD